MAKTKARRKSVLENPEEVLNLAQSLMEQAKRRWPWLALGLTVVVLALAVWLIRAAVLERREGQAAAALAQVLPRLSESEAGAEAAKELEHLAREHPGTRAARQARLLRANLLYQAKDYAPAARAYESLLPSGDPAWDALIDESLSYCYEGMGDPQKAVAALKAAVEQLPGPLKDEMRQRLALLLERAGDYQQAALYWRQLLEECNRPAPGKRNPEMASYLKERLRQAESKLKKQ